MILYLFLEKKPINNCNITYVDENREVRVLILGSNPETSEVVRVANLEGYKTFVVNPVEDSPAKKIAAVSYHADPKNLHVIDEIIYKEKINSVVLGVSDPLLPFYREICERHGFPCYANKESVKILSSKFEFSKYCQLFQIKPIPTFDVNQIYSLPADSNPFPVVVKPIDNGAAVGISLCEDWNEFKIGIELALEKSIAKQIIVEKYMDCDDLFAYYTITNGKARLTMLADRFKSRKTGKFNSVCLYANYPSKHLKSFLATENSKFVTMIESLQINTGVLGVQVFYDGSDFYAYDPGFRIQGEGPHFYLNAIYDYDQIRMMLNFAVKGKASEESVEVIVDPELTGYLARTIWVLGSPGIVSEIHGLEELTKNPNVIKILNRFFPDDALSAEMIGTERQVLMRIYTLGKNELELDETSRYVSETLRVLDQDGNSLISDLYSPLR
jgi:formate-dependent phosphoribosylglycinamide formyltransferase (GAR transformylase)